jgi:hypothetical protein
MTLRLIIFLPIIAIALISCQQIQQQTKAEASQQMMAEISICREVELTPKNAIERIDCIASARRKFGATVSPNTMWVLEQDLAADRESAVEYSEGKISKERYQTAIQKHYADGAATEAQALAEMQQQNAQNAANALSAYSAMQSITPHPVPSQPYMMPVNRPVNTNCNQIGNTVNCTSY